MATETPRELRVIASVHPVSGGEDIAVIVMVGRANLLLLDRPNLNRYRSAAVALVVWGGRELGLAQKVSLRQAIVIRSINLLIALRQLIGSCSELIALETGPRLGGLPAEKSFTGCT